MKTSENAFFNNLFTVTITKNQISVESSLSDLFRLTISISCIHLSHSYPPSRNRSRNQKRPSNSRKEIDSSPHRSDQEQTYFDLWSRWRAATLSLGSCGRLTQKSSVKGFHFGLSTGKKWDIVTGLLGLIFWIWL